MVLGKQEWMKEGLWPDRSGRRNRKMGNREFLSRKVTSSSLCVRKILLAATLRMAASESKHQPGVQGEDSPDWGRQ